MVNIRAAEQVKTWDIRKLGNYKKIFEMLVTDEKVFSRLHESEKLQKISWKMLHRKTDVLLNFVDL